MVEKTFRSIKGFGPGKLINHTLIGEMHVKHFLDWARTKDIAVVAEDGTEQLVMVKQLTFEDGDEIYVESGFSRRIIENLMIKGCTVYRIDAKVASDERLYEKGTDMEDAHWLKELYSIQPALFIQVTPLTKKEAELKRLYGMYRQVTRDITRFKLIQQSMEWEHGQTAYGEAIENLVVLKKDTFKQMKPLIKDELKKVEKLNKGLGGGMLLAQLLAVAHPKNFASKSKYLAYVGCKARTFWKEQNKDGQWRGRGRFNRDAAHIGYLMATSVMKAKDPELYQFYLDLKEQGMFHGRAMNRLRTMIMKKIYNALH